MAARLTSDAPARLFYERSVGALDATVGRLLGDPELEKRGAALVERSDALGRAAHLDATATQKREQADDELKAKRDEALQDQKEARTAKAQEVEHAKSTAEERKRAAADAAAQRTAAVKRQADEAAARRVNSAEAAKRDEQAKIRAAEQQATAAAASKREDAQAKLGDAEQARAGRPGRAIGRRREAETPSGAREHHQGVTEHRDHGSHITAFSTMLGAVILISDAIAADLYVSANATN